MNRGENQAGFTLIEIMVVLALVALFAVVSLPYATSGENRTRLVSTARVVAARLRAVRAAAIDQNRPFALEIDLTRLEISDSRNVPTEILPADFAMTITSAQNQTIEGRAIFGFFADGGSTGGRVVLSNGTRSASINVNWLTGAIVVESGDQK